MIIKKIWLVLLLVGFWSSGVFAADPSAGKKIYITQCQNCHGANGSSPIPGTPDFSRGERLMQADLTILANIKQGKNMMPAFQGMFTDNQILDLIAYLRTFQ
ncbi:MAG: c-type cytochrome [Gammaproteobacteria bacterium]